MTVHLRRSAFLDDWFVLEGGPNWASVEGPTGDWLELVAAIRAREPRSFRRCAVRFSEQFATFWSPRNAAGSHDCVLVATVEVDALADQIEAELRTPTTPRAA